MVRLGDVGHKGRFDGSMVQGTVEYAIVTSVLLAMVLACAAIWRAGENGVWAHAAQEGASHGEDARGALDVALY